MQGLEGKGQRVHWKMEKQYDHCDPLGKYELQADVKTIDLLVPASDGKDPVVEC